MTRWLRSTTVGVSLTLLAVAGCGTGSPTKTVVMSGNVTYDGKPIESGTITFMCMEAVKGRTGSEGKIENGRYKLLDVIPGKNTVTIKVIPKQATIKSYDEQKAKQKMYAEMSKGAMNQKSSPEDMMTKMGFGDRVNQIPDNAEGNNATITVPESGGTQDFPLTKPAGKK